MLRVVEYILRAALLNYFAGVHNHDLIGQIGTTTAGFADMSAPSGTDSAAGDQLIAEHYSSANLNATEFLFKFSTPIWAHADDLQTI